MPGENLTGEARRASGGGVVVAGGRVFCVPLQAHENASNNPSQ